METYTFTTLYILVMELFLALSLIGLLKHADLKKPAIAKASVIFGTWLALVVLFFGPWHLLSEDIESMSLFIIILIGVGVSGILFYLLKEEFLHLPQELLLMPQAFRMFFGAGFIIEAVYEIIPALYGVIDGILHITTAFLATTLAIWIARGCACRRSLVLVNLFGLLDIVIVAYGISFFILEDIGGHHNVFYAVFFAAPIFIWLHLISLYKLLPSKRMKEDT